MKIILQLPMLLCNTVKAKKEGFEFNLRIIGKYIWSLFRVDKIDT